MLTNAGWIGLFDSTNQSNPGSFYDDLGIKLTDPFVGSAATVLLLDDTSQFPILIGIHDAQHGTSVWNPQGPVSADFNSADTIVWMVATVPIPATIWLFGSGLLGLIGLARRKSSVYTAQTLCKSAPPLRGVLFA